MKEQVADINSYLIFKLGDEEFAANAGKVQRILEQQTITKIPNMPKYMKGVINLMGKVLPVIDARVKFNLQDTELTSNSCIIVLEIKKSGVTIEIGALVDSVQSVLEIDKDQIKTPPTINNSEYNSDFIKGMVEQNNKFIMVLDIDSVFSSAELVNLKQVADIEEQIEQTK